MRPWPTEAFWDTLSGRTAPNGAVRGAAVNAVSQQLVILARAESMDDGLPPLGSRDEILERLAPPGTEARRSCGCAVPRLTHCADGQLRLPKIVTASSSGLLKRHLDDVCQILVHAGMRARWWQKRSLADIATISVCTACYF